MAKDMYQKRKERQENKKNEIFEEKKTNINWYPGHMYKAKREIKESLNLIDVVIELLDSRIPKSSRNPDILKIADNKKRVIVLNKCDLADSSVNNMWINYFKNQGIKAILVNSIDGNGINNLEKLIREEMEEVLKQQASKGRIGRTIKCVILGIPNVGKSSIINKISGKSVLITANKPGVTKANKWLRLAKGIELLDTPGVLWPKFEEKVGINLALTGAIREEILDSYELAFNLIEFLKQNYSQDLLKRYKLEDISNLNNLDIIDLIGKKRGCLVSGGLVDTRRTSHMILDEFQSGKIGKISLERP